MCQNPGPYFAGMSVEACAAHGGTWCANPVDCQDLQLCIEEYKTSAEENNQMSFLEYLESAPAIEDFTDPKQCGKTREYFGFDDSFSNDKQICEDILQLQYARDFSFLDDFFGAGEDGPAPGEEVDGPTLAPAGPPVPDLDLEEPDHGRFRCVKYVSRWEYTDVNLFAKLLTAGSLAKPVQDGQAWRATNFAFQEFYERWNNALKMMEAVPCPGLGLVPGPNPCEIIKYALIIILWILKHFQKLVSVN